jgi:hypothetical protein
MASSNQVFVSHLANLRVLSDDNCIIAREKPVKPIGMGKWKVSYDFTMFPDAYTLAKYLVAQPVGRRRFHEVIRPGRQKVFVDIDLTPDKAPDGDHMVFGQTILQLMIQCMESYCRERGIPFDLEQDVAISTSHCATKFSAHIIFPHHLVVSTDGEMRYFVEHELCGVAKERPEMRHALEKLVIDLGVYARTHNFRIVYSDKVNDKGRILAPADEFEYYGRRIVHTRPMDAPEYIYLENIIMFCHRDRCFELSVKVPKRPKKESSVEEDEAEIVLEQLYENLPIAEGTFELRSVSADIIQLNRLLPFDCPACKGHHDGDNPYIRIFKYHDSEARYASLCCRAKKSIKFYCLDPEIAAQPKPLNAMAFAMVASFRRREGLDDDEKPVEIPDIIPEPKRPVAKVTKLADIQYPTIQNPSPFAPDPNLRADMEEMRKTEWREKPAKKTRKPEPEPEPESIDESSEDDEPEVEIVERPIKKEYIMDEDKPKCERSGYNFYDKKYHWSDFVERFQQLELISYCGHIIDDLEDDRFDAAVDAIHAETRRPKKTITCDTPSTLVDDARRVIAIVNDSVSLAKVFCKTEDEMFERSSRPRLAANAGGSCQLIKVDKRGKIKYERFRFSTFLSRYESKLSYKRVVTIPFPNDPDGLLPDPTNIKRGEFNIFPGFRARLVKLNDERRATIQPFLTHLERYTANGDKDIYRWILWWFRRIIVEYKKPDMMLMFVGDQGAGKGIIFDMFGNILGDELYLSIGTLEAFFQDFNKMQSQKLLIYIQEFGKAKGNQHTLYDKFKARIDQRKCTVEAKFNDAYQEVNRSGIGASSNHPEMIRAVDGDRRSIFIRASDELRNNAEYWDEFYKNFPKIDDDPERNQEISNILYSYLHSEECKNFVEIDPETGTRYNYFRPPKTELRDEIVEQSRNLGQEYIHELMTKAKRVEPGTIITSDKLADPFMLSDNIWDSFVNWMRDRSISPEYQMRRPAFMTEVRKWTGSKSMQTKVAGGARPSGYRISGEIYKRLVTVWESPDSDSEDGDFVTK